jgi:mRNA export factor
MSGIFGSSSASATQQSNTLGDLSKDVLLESPPEDSISDISFSTQSDHLAVASWDNKVRIYEITQDGKSAPRAMFEHEGPVLSCHWSKVSAEG